VSSRRWLVALALACLAVGGCYGQRMPDVPAAQPTCAPQKILIAGDSLMAQAEPAIGDQLRQAGYTPTIEDMVHGGSNALEYGLSVIVGDPPPYASPRAELQHYLDTFHPDVVLVDWGISRSFSMWFPGVPYYLEAWVMNNAETEVRDMVAASGAELYWTTIPPRGDDEDWYATEINAQIANLGVALVDWRGALTDTDGNYQRYLKYPEDDWVRPVRTDDSIHLEPDGITRVARWTAAALAHEGCSS
jgi:hypothetical protein